MEELKRIANEKGLTFIPQKSTPKARKLAGIEADAKTDEVDTRSVSSEGSKCILFTERIFSKEIRFFKDEISNTVEYIKECNADINPAKSSEYGFGKIDYDDEVSKWIKKYTLKLVEYLDGDLELINAIGPGFDKRGT